MRFILHHFSCQSARFFRIGFFAIILLSLGISCSKQERQTTAGKQAIVARIGNNVITADEFRLSYETGFGNLKTGSDRKRTYLKYMIKERLLAQEGYRLGLDKSERVKTLERRLLDELLIESLLETEVKSKIKITPEEIRREINKSKVSFKYRYWAEDSYRKAQAVSEAMRRRGYAEVLNDMLSKDPEKRISPHKFESKYLTYLEIPPELLEAIKDLPIGEISDPVPLNGKYFIFQVLDIRRSGVTENEYKSRAGSFEQIIFQRKYQQAIARYVSQILQPRQVVAKGTAFQLLANAIREWQKTEKDKREDFDRAIRHGDSRQPALNALKNALNDPMITYSDGSISVAEFLKEFNLTKFLSQKNLEQNFIGHLQEAVKLAIRDHFLVEQAKQKNLQNTAKVQQELARWRNKWTYQEMRHRLIKNIDLKEEEVREYFRTHQTKYRLRWDKKPQLAAFAKKARQDAYLQKELNLLNRQIESLKKQFPVEINQAVLDTIKVIDFQKSHWATFQVFQMGTNRPLCPVVDPEWAGE